MLAFVLEKQVSPARRPRDFPGSLVWSDNITLREGGCQVGTMGIYFSRLWGALGLLLLFGRAQALDPSHRITQYAHQAWSGRDARLPGGIFSITQTADGELWAGTDSGIVRFDGVRFLAWRPAGQQLPSEWIGALLPARDGSLWIGTRAGLSHWDGTHLENYPTSHGVSGPGVDSILETRDGTVWAGSVGYHSGELCRVESGKLRCRGVADGLAGPGVCALFQDHRGNLWVGSSGGVTRWQPGAPQAYHLGEMSAMVCAIAGDPAGDILVSTGTELGRLENGKLVPYLLGPETQRVQPGALLFDRDGGLWVATFGQGLLHFFGGHVDRYTHTDGLSSDVVNCLFEDREGNIWAGTDGGLDRFRDFPVTTLTKREGLAGDITTAVLASRTGAIWIGTISGLNRIENSRITTFDKAQGLPSSGITGIFEERGGRLWVDTAGGLAYLEQGRFHRLESPVARRLRTLGAAAEDRSHRVWLSDPEQGLICLQAGRVQEVVPWSQFGNKKAWALEADRAGDGLWIGFVDGGLAYWRPGAAPRWYRETEGLTRGAVIDLHADPDGVLWIATQNGLSRLQNGQLRSLGVANGLPCDRIHAVVADDLAALWLNTACGLVRIAGAEFDAWVADPRYKIKTKVYDAEDGMRTQPQNSGYFRPAAKDRDGRLWFALVDGVAVVDPRRLPLNRVPPPVHIEQIVADNQLRGAGKSSTLPPLTKEIHIDYTACSFVAPDRVRFRYRLDGFDRQWQEAGELRRAVYTNLAPKHYRFRVIAANNDGLWNETGAAIDFSIQPAFYQTSWFRLLCVGATALLLWSLYRLRLRRIAAQMVLRFEERLAERSRIGRELHDTLLQNIAGFALQLEGLSKTVTGPPSARLRELRAQAEQWLREARESVWDLRSPALEGRNFLSALEETAGQMIQGKDAHFQLTVCGKRRPAQPRVEEQLLRILQEATRNAVNHAQARHIQVNVAYLNGKTIQIQMRDDGCGFDLGQASRKEGHYGLATMRERASQIGADFKISSIPGQGTEIDILVKNTRWKK